MFHQFFKQTLGILKRNNPLIENTAFVVEIGASAYCHSKLSQYYANSCMTLFYSRLSEEDKLAVEKDPQKEKEFIEDCKTRLSLMIGPPD